MILLLVNTFEENNITNINLNLRCAILEATQLPKVWQY